MHAWSILIGCLVATVMGASAQASAFVGAWRVNHGAGDPPSQSTVEQVWEVSQTANELTLRVLVRGKETSSHTWPLDGRAITANRDGAPETTSVAIGKGELVISGSRQSADGSKADFREQWVIDPATKSLRVAKVISTVATTFTRRLVLDPVAKP